MEKAESPRSARMFGGNKKGRSKGTKREYQEKIHRWQAAVVFLCGETSLLSDILSGLRFEALPISVMPRESNFFTVRTMVSRSRFNWFSFNGRSSIVPSI